MHMRWTMLALVTLAGCGAEPEGERAAPAPVTGTPVAVLDTLLPAVIEAAGTAEPVQQATLASRLMAAVLEVTVREGDRVAAGQVLVRIDTRDLEARQGQVGAGLAEAEAVERDAEAMARRIRALYADSAATRVQLEQAETGLARAQAAVRSARAAAAELEAVRSYAEVRAPFAGVVTRRFVDAGAMAAPGSPLVMVDDVSRLRVEVTAGTGQVAGLRRGSAVDVTVDGQVIRGEVEGVVSAGVGNLAQVNVVVPNRSGAILGRSAATVLLPQGTRAAMVVPAAALVREGDLVGVELVTEGGVERRWVRIGRELPGGLVEVLSGVAGGDRVLVRGAAPGGN